MLSVYLPKIDNSIKRYFVFFAKSMIQQCIFKFSEGITNAVVGTNLTLACTSQSDNVWWTKDGINITNTDNRYVLINIYNIFMNTAIEPIQLFLCI